MKKTKRISLMALFILIFVPVGHAIAPSAFDLSGHDDPIEFRQAFPLDVPISDFAPTPVPVVVLVRQWSEGMKPPKFGSDRLVDQRIMVTSFSLRLPEESIQGVFREIDAAPGFAGTLYMPLISGAFPDYRISEVPSDFPATDSHIDSTAFSGRMSEPIVNILLGTVLICLSGLLRKKALKLRPDQSSPPFGRVRIRHAE
jgi:hypothetical protein